MPGEKKTDFKKNVFSYYFFHGAHAFGIPNPKDGHVTPKTQKVTTENVENWVLFYHKAGYFVPTRILNLHYSMTDSAAGENFSK